MRGARGPWPAHPYVMEQAGPPTAAVAGRVAIDERCCAKGAAVRPALIPLLDGFRHSASKMRVNAPMAQPTQAGTALAQARARNPLCIRQKPSLIEDRHSCNLNESRKQAVSIPDRKMGRPAAMLVCVPPDAIKNTKKAALRPPRPSVRPSTIGACRRRAENGRGFLIRASGTNRSGVRTHAGQDV